MSVLAAVKYTVGILMELFENGTLSIDCTSDNWDGMPEKGHEIKYLTDEKNNHTMSYIVEPIERNHHRLDLITIPKVPK